MSYRNISDVIEEYLKKFLTNERQISISRSKVANHFNVVPSQINYVIRTRFTISNGYVVNSKRGGGGYIRIERVKLLNNFRMINNLIRSVGKSLSQQNGESLLKTLNRARLIDRKEVKLILAVISKRTLNLGNTKLENVTRARIIISVLNHLRFEN